jgi:hypothetical protein
VIRASVLCGQRSRCSARSQPAARQRATRSGGVECALVHLKRSCEGDKYEPSRYGPQGSSHRPLGAPHAWFTRIAGWLSLQRVPGRRKVQ